MNATISPAPILPHVQQVDTFTDSDGNIFGLEKYQNRNGNLQTKYYLSYNGKIDDISISLESWKRLKAKF